MTIDDCSIDWVVFTGAFPFFFTAVGFFRQVSAPESFRKDGSVR